MRQDITVNDWEEFIRVANSLDVGTSFKTAFEYRGQSDSEWPLLPSLLRRIYELKLSISDALELERLAVKDFIAQGHLHLDPNMFSTLNNPQTRQDVWWTLMQDHGAPTRLLDWTASPYVAAYFAVNSDFDRDGAIWLMHSRTMEVDMTAKYGDINQLVEKPGFAECFLTENAPQHLVFFKKSTRTARMVNQQGIFTICRNIMGCQGTGTFTKLGDGNSYEVAPWKR